MRQQEFLPVLIIQGVTLLTRIAAGKLQQVKENALCWSLKTLIFGPVVHLARVITLKYKMALPLTVFQAGEDVDQIKTVG